MVGLAIWHLSKSPPLPVRSATWPESDTSPSTWLTGPNIRTIAVPPGDCSLPYIALTDRPRSSHTRSRPHAGHDRLHSLTETEPEFARPKRRRTNGAALLQTPSDRLQPPRAHATRAVSSQTAYQRGRPAELPVAHGALCPARQCLKYREPPRLRTTPTPGLVAGRHTTSNCPATPARSHDALGDCLNVLNDVWPLTARRARLFFRSSSTEFSSLPNPRGSWWHGASPPQDDLISSYQFFR
jgi:hypothetical protein